LSNGSKIDIIMATGIKGLKFENDAKGRAKKVIFDLDLYGEMLEDIIDGIVADARKNEPGIAVEDFIKKQNQKRGISVRKSKNAPGNHPKISAKGN